MPAASQNVVFCFANTDYAASANRTATFDLSASVPGGANWFGIEPGRTYNVTNELAVDPDAPVWTSDRTGSDLIANCITVSLTGAVTGLNQAQYLRLVDTSVPADTDHDGMPDAWETANGLEANNPNDPTADDDGDGQSNLHEYLAGTDPQSSSSRLAITTMTRGVSTVTLTWSSVSGKSYIIQACTDLTSWQTEESSPGVPLVIGATGSQTSQTIPVPAGPKRFFRIAVAE